VFTIDQNSIQIKAFNEVAFGAPHVESWRKLFAKHKDGEA
jgi:hypothetical protein